MPFWQNALAMAQSKSEVNDKWVFFALYPVMAIAIIYIGNDNSIEKLLLIPSFYSDILIAFLCTYGIGYYLKWLFHHINQKFNWQNQLKQRLIYQSISGLVAPIVILVSIEIVYLFFLGIPLKESSVFYLEMPLIILFCSIINLIYFSLYFHQYNTILQIGLELPKKPKDTFIAKSGNQFTNIPQEEVSYFVTQNKICFLITSSGKRCVYDTTLKKLRDTLPQEDFFQPNRQFILARKGISSYQRKGTRRLELELKPPSDQPVIVAKTKVSEFLEWFDTK